MNGAGAARGAAGALVRELALGSAIGPERATRLRAVVEELVHEAGERPRALAVEGDDLTVRVGIDSGRFKVEVCDRALPLAPGESRRAPSRRLAALGFVDELHIGAHGRAGNVASCSLRLEPLEADLGGERVLQGEVERASEEAVAALVIRPMEPGDALGLVRCLYRCYGYSYKDPVLYEPRHIVEDLRSERMHSVVAVSAEGEVVGHSAVFAEDRGDRVPEAGRLVVDPRYRGHGLAERMSQLRHTLARDAGFSGYWAEAVTNHPASQREILHLGGSETGLLIGGSPAAVAMAGFENPNRGRRTLLVTHTVLRAEPATIHLPSRHAEFAAGLAERLGLERTVVSEPAAPGDRGSRIHTSVITGSELAHLRVAEIGADLPERVADELEGLDAFDLGAIHLDVPLADPAAAAMVERLEPLGFSFAAWMPDFLPGGDGLRLQRVGSHPVDAEHVVCARPEGEEVRDRVVAEWHRVRRAGLG